MGVRRWQNGLWHTVGKRESDHGQASFRNLPCPILSYKCREMFDFSKTVGLFLGQMAVFNGRSRGFQKFFIENKFIISRLYTYHSPI